MPGMKFGTRAKVVVLVVAAVGGYGGAAAINALATPSFAIADDFGPDDGLTRYVVTASATDAAGLAAGVPEVPGVVTAQRLTDGRTLVATRGLAPAHLQRVPGVTGVEVSQSGAVLGAVSDPYGASYGWNLENTGSNSYQQPVPPIADADTDAPDAWSTGQGTGMVVAVVDTGYDSDHEDLAGALWTNPDEPCGSADTDGNGKAGDCHGWNFYANSADVDNGSYGEHGTSVSGVVAAREGNGLGSAGVAPAVTVMPLVIGGGSSVDVNLGSEAIRYAVDHGADVINASWGGPFTGSALAGLRSAIAYAAAHDVLVVAAAGNDGQNRDAAPSDRLYPAALTEDDVITVGSSTAADTVSPTSAWGPATVDLFAPGYLVFTTWNDGGYRFVSGTSIAAPQVAGVLALYRAAMPTASAAQLKQALLADVDPVASFAGRSVTGGRLSAAHIGSTGGPRFTFTSMTSPAGVLTPHVAVTAPAGTGTYAAEIGLGMEDSGEIWALSGADVALNGATLTTDDSGTAQFTLGTRTSIDGEQIQPSLDLADGRYVLTVQLYRDGVPFGRASAAPLLVGTAATTPSTGTGTAPSTGTGTGGGSTPSTGTGTGTGTPPGIGTAPGAGTGGGGSTPSTGNPGTPSTPGTDTRTGTGSAPSTGTGTGSTPSTGTDTGGTPPPAVGSSADPGTRTGGTTPSPGTGTGSTPSTGTDAGTGDTTPSTGTGTGGTTPPSSGVGGFTTYPGTGPFGLVRIAPSTVTTGGSTNVTITATALPANPRVRIGRTTTAAVVSASSTTLVFTARGTLVAGSYDVVVFNAAGTTSDTLPGGLTYVDAGTGGATPGTGTGSSSTPSTGGPGSGGSTPPAAGTGTGTGGTTPSTGTGTGSGSGSGGSGTATVTKTGAHGERLVRSARFRALSTLWSLDCSSPCSGVAI